MNDASDNRRFLSMSGTWRGSIDSPKPKHLASYSLSLITLNGNEGLTAETEEAEEITQEFSATAAFNQSRTAMASL